MNIKGKKNAYRVSIICTTVLWALMVLLSHHVLNEHGVELRLT